jgi:uncharacterized membrane protein
MTNHNIESEEKNYNNLYYVIALLTGIVTAALINLTFISILTGAVAGLIVAAFFVNVLVRKSEK